MRRRDGRADGPVDMRSEGSDTTSVGVEEKPMSSIPIPGTASVTAPSPNDRSSAHVGHYRRFYFLHSISILVILVLGMIHNGDSRKYIPVNPKELLKLATIQSSKVASGMINSGDLSGMGLCRKAYVNVHSTSIEETNAVICCSALAVQSKDEKYQSNLCHPRIPVIGIYLHQLPFATRLTRLTEAWVLPLIPIIIRLIYQLVVLMYSFVARHLRWGNWDDVIMQQEATPLSNSQASSSSLSSNRTSVLLDKIVTDSSSTATTLPFESKHELIRTTLQRLLFYFFLLNFRGWVLYAGANALEDYGILPWITGNTVASSLRVNSMSDVEQDMHYSDDETGCWYKEALKPHHKAAMENYGHSYCYGQPFDFSDHVVLFLAHYLPIFVMEMLFCYSFPFWVPLATEKVRTKQKQSNYLLLKGMAWNIFHIFLFLYLHLLVLHALYLTAVYFHTPAEILVGYGVSLILQFPVGFLMCSDGWPKVKRFIGLPSEGGMRSEKVD